MLRAVMFTFESLKVFQYYTDFKRRYIFMPGAKLSIAKCLQVMKNEKYSKQLSPIPLQQQDLKMPFPTLCNYLYIFFSFGMEISNFISMEGSFNKGWILLLQFL